MRSLFADLRARLTAAETLFDGKSERERLQMGLAILAALAALWLLVLHQPQQARREEIARQSESQREISDTTRRELATLQAASAHDPVAAQRDEKERLEVEIADLGARLDAAGTAVLPPREIVALLGELLATQSDLRLVRVESLEPEPVLDAAATAKDAPPPSIFRHPVEIELEAGYLPTLRWVDVLETLPWKLHWDSLDYEVIEHPRAKVLIRFHTLGREEAWIRA